MDKNHGVWSLDSIRGFITREEEEAIKKILIPMLYSEDKLCWPHDKSGSYSSKSGYHRLKELESAEVINRASYPHIIDRRVRNLI